MKYSNISEAKFIERPNRFVARVEVDNKIETVHVKNTGRCKELLLPNSKVVLAKAENPARKTKYDLVAVYKENLGWVNIDSQAPNQIMKEWLESEQNYFQNITFLKPEFTFGNSRVDFYLECENRKILVEVKGCTLEIDGIGYFPDAPTLRGIKHLNELENAVKEGFECYIAFVITMPKVQRVLPNVDTHREFGEALERAKKAGVKVLCFPCKVTPDELKITDVIDQGKQED